MQQIQFPPRGSGRRGVPEAAPSQTWQDPSLLGDDWSWRPGGILLGSWGDRFLGVPEEAGSHVVLLGGETVLMSTSAPRTASLLQERGLDVVTVGISEYEKLEGCVTCLSVRVR